MPILAFNPEQLLLLSTCAVTEPTERSPLRRLYLQADRISTERSFREAIEDFAKEGMLVPDASGKPRLARALEPVLWILHRPEQTLSFIRVGAPDVAEAFFCRSGRTWVQDAVNVAETLDVLMYPYTAETMATWFAEELLGDVRLDRSRLPERSVTVTVPELVMLVAVQQVYRGRVERGVKLTGDALSIARWELAAPAVATGIAPVATAFMPFEHLQELLSREDLLASALGGLVARGLVDDRDGAVRFTEWSREVFDPGKQLAVVVAKNWGERLNASILYVLEGGFAAVGTTPGPEGDLQLRSLPGTTPKEEVFEWLLEGIAAEP